MATLFQRVVAIADKITKQIDAQAIVTIKTLTGDGGVGDPVEVTKKTSAVITKKLRQVRNGEGQLVASTHSVLILDPTVKVTPKDQVFLPDGTGGPIMSIQGAYDASGQLLSEVFLG